MASAKNRPLDFHTPYGCSKGAADQYVLDYARSFEVPTAVLRMSCVYGQRQMGTEDQGWVAHFVIRALEGKPITLFGDGYQVRDILDVSATRSTPIWRRGSGSMRFRGRAFNLGGGPAERRQSSRPCWRTSSDVDRPRHLEVRFIRTGAPATRRYFVADTRAAQAALGLGERRPWQDGVAALAKSLSAARGLNWPVGEAMQRRAAS